MNLIFYAMAPENYVEGVYTFHGLKALRDPHMVDLFGGDIAFPFSLFHNIGEMIDGKEFTKELFYHGHLWLGLIVAPLIGAATYLFDPVATSADERAKRHPLRFFDPRRFFVDGAPGIAAILWLAALALFVQYAMFRELYSFYWVLIYPTLALSLAFSLVYGARLAARAYEAATARRRAVALGCAVACLAVIALHRPWSASVQSVFADEIEAAGTRNDYSWKPAPVLAGLSDVTRALFWEDYRFKGNVEPGYRHYLWTKKRGFSTLDEIGDFIRERSTPEETVAGASTSAPLVALAAERRVAANEADTNNKRFKTGLLTEADYWNAICADNVRFIVSTPRSYFTQRRMDSMPTAKRWFRRAQRFLDYELRYRGALEIVLYERVGEPPEPGKVCRWEG